MTESTSWRRSRSLYWHPLQPLRLVGRLGKVGSHRAVMEETKIMKVDSRVKGLKEVKLSLEKTRKFFLTHKPYSNTISSRRRIHRSMWSQSSFRKRIWHSCLMIPFCITSWKIMTMTRLQLSPQERFISPPLWTLWSVRPIITLHSSQS